MKYFSKSCYQCNGLLPKEAAALEAVTVDSPAADTVLVRGGLVVSGAGAEQTDILVEGGLVVAVGPGLQQPVHPHTLVEAAGLLVTAGVAGAVPGLPGAAVVLEQIPADRSVAEHLAVRQPTAEDFCLVAGLVEGQDPAQLVAAGVSVLQLEPGLTPAQLMSALLAAGRAGAVARMELRPGLAGQEVELRRAATMARQAAASLLLTGVTDPAATALLARLCEAGWAVAGEPRAGPEPRDRADPARWVREQLEPAARLLGRQTELVADGPADLVVWGEAGAQWVLRGGRVHVAAGVPVTSPTTGSLIRLPVRPRATNVQTRRVDRAPPAPAPAPAPREEVQPVSLEPTSPFQRKLSVHGVRNQQDSTFSLTELHTPAPVTQQHRRASVKVNAPPGGLSKSFW